MAVFAYTKISDFVLDDILGFASINSIKNSVRYIAEDVLGDPSTNSDKPGTTFNNNVFEGYTRPNGTAPGVRGVAISSSSAGFTTTSPTFVDVTNLSVTLVTTGRPVLCCIASDGAGNSLSIGPIVTVATSTKAMNIKLLRDAVEVGQWILSKTSSPSDIEGMFPSPGIIAIDPIGAGTYVYKIQAFRQGSGSASFLHARLVAFEL